LLNSTKRLLRYVREKGEEMDLMEPFENLLDLESGFLKPAARVIRRHLGDMRHMFADSAAVSEILEEEGERLIYEVLAPDLPEKEGLVLYSTTIIYPGRIGSEFHMTKGHFHELPDRSEVYLGLAGDGYLVLQTAEGVVRGVPMRRGTIAYVPPYWAHRTVNIGDEPFSFIAFWPGDAGHNYGAIEHTGFAELLVDGNGRLTFIPNPKFRTIEH
jgi:glucose-6-phosphate isomerase